VKATRGNSSEGRELKHPIFKFPKKKNMLIEVESLEEARVSMSLLATDVE
jgi:hypothetical protein